MRISEKTRFPLKRLRLLLFAALAACPGCASGPELCEAADSSSSVSYESGRSRGLIPDCRFTPFQTGFGNAYLCGGEPDCLILFTPFNLFTEQYSGVLSLIGIGTLEYNYGVFCGIEPRAEEENYGLLCGLVTGAPAWRHYGIQVGCVNATGYFSQIQLCGVDVAHCLRIALVNMDNGRESGMVDVGLFNTGETTPLQIGLLNHNKRGLCSWLPLFNFRWD